MKVGIKEMIILDKYTDLSPTVDPSKGEDFNSLGLQIDFECALAMYELAHVEYTAETKAIEAYTEANGVESLYASQFKVLVEEANEGFKAKFRNALTTIQKFFSEMWTRFSNWISRIFVSDEKMIKKIEKDIDKYAPKTLSTIDHNKCLDIISSFKKDAEDAYTLMSGDVVKIENPEEAERLLNRTQELYQGFKEGANIRGDKSYKEAFLQKFEDTSAEKEVDPKELLQTYKNALSTFKDFDKKTFSAASILMRKISLKMATIAAKNVVDDDEVKEVEKSGKELETEVILICKEINNCMNGVSASITYLYNKIRSDFKKLVKEPEK